MTTAPIPAPGPVTPNRPNLVGSLSSGVDGASEGGRLSSTRLPTTLMIYSVPLVSALRRAGYNGRLSAEPALLEGGWVLNLTYYGEPPEAVPERWHGHRVVLTQAPPDA